MTINIHQITNGKNSAIAITDDGRVFAWGGVLAFPNANDLEIIKKWHDISRVTLGNNHLLAIGNEGQVVYGIGMNTFGQSIHKSFQSPVVDIAVGNQHSLALCADGRVFAWGNRMNDRCEVPSDLPFAVQVAAGDSYSVALLHSRDVVIWGASNNPRFSVPVGLENVKQIASGSDHIVALKNDGRVVAWGVNVSGQCSVPRTLPPVKQVAAGDRFTVVLCDDGTVRAWGRNDAEQCVVPQNLSNVVQITAGHSHVTAVLESGRLVMWGELDVCRIPYDFHLTTLETTKVDAIWDYRFLESLISQTNFIASGGEATVFKINDKLAYKKYTTQPNNISNKLLYMLNNNQPSNSLHKSVAWPISRVMNGNNCVGYVMPYINAKSLDLLIEDEFFKTNKRMMISVAIECADILQTIHAHSYVVGDLKPSNILVDVNGRTTFIDCDSYQIRDGIEFPCRLESPDYKSPDLVGYQYTRASDLYALSVIYFEMFCGCHPYLGIPQEPINMFDIVKYNMERRIWPFDESQQKMIPHAAAQQAYNSMPTDIQRLFVSAFTADAQYRPEASTWIHALRSWLQQLSY